jgi:hypothetical protein
MYFPASSRVTFPSALRPRCISKISHTHLEGYGSTCTRTSIYSHVLVKYTSTLGASARNCTEIHSEFVATCTGSQCASAIQHLLWAERSDWK